MAVFVQDLRYGLRMMTANPLFTAMAALSLALGIGANTAIYGFLDSIVMRALPVQHPEQLTVIHWQSKDQPAVIESMSGTRHKDARNGVNSPNYPYAAFDLFRADSDVFSNLFAYAWGGRPNTVVEGQAEILDAELVSGGFFGGLGLACSLWARGIQDRPRDRHQVAQPDPPGSSRYPGGPDSDH